MEKLLDFFPNMESLSCFGANGLLVALVIGGYDSSVSSFFLPKKGLATSFLNPNKEPSFLTNGLVSLFSNIFPKGGATFGCSSFLLSSLLPSSGLS